MLSARRICQLFASFNLLLLLYPICLLLTIFKCHWMDIHKHFTIFESYGNQIIIYNHEWVIGLGFGWQIYRDSQLPCCKICVGTQFHLSYY